MVEIKQENGVQTQMYFCIYILHGNNNTKLHKLSYLELMLKILTISIRFFSSMQDFFFV